MYGSEGYQPAALHWLDVINNYFIDADITNYKFIDVGSGKGKVILYNILKKAPFLNYVGIEGDEKYHNVFLNANGSQLLS